MPGPSPVACSLYIVPIVLRILGSATAFHPFRAVLLRHPTLPGRRDPGMRESRVRHGCGVLTARGWRRRFSRQATSDIRGRPMPAGVWGRRRLGPLTSGVGHIFPGCAALPLPGSPDRRRASPLRRGPPEKPLTRRRRYLDAMLPRRSAPLRSAPLLRTQRRRARSRALSIGAGRNRPQHAAPSPAGPGSTAALLPYDTSAPPSLTGPVVLHLLRPMPPLSWRPWAQAPVCRLRLSLRKLLLPRNPHASERRRLSGRQRGPRLFGGAFSSLPGTAHGNSPAVHGGRRPVLRTRSRSPVPGRVSWLP